MFQWRSFVIGILKNQILKIDDANVTVKTSKTADFGKCYMIHTVGLQKRTKCIIYLCMYLSHYNTVYISVESDLNICTLTEESGFIDNTIEDPDFVLDNDDISATRSESDDEMNDINTNRYFLVYESQLKKLLLRCLTCGSKIDHTLTKKSLAIGSQFSVQLHCFSGHSFTWKAQPDLPNVKGMGNIDLVSAVTLAGIPLAKFEKFAWLLGLKCFNASSFYRIRKNYIAPIICETWEKERKKVTNVYFKTYIFIVLEKLSILSCLQYFVYNVLQANP